jgi:hypothetical protein
MDKPATQAETQAEGDSLGIRGDHRAAERSIPAAYLADGQRHTDQYERERGRRSASLGGDRDGAVILRLRVGKLLCTIGHQTERKVVTSTTS